MDERKLNDWLGDLPVLTATEKQCFEAALANAGPDLGVTRELDAMGVTECPHCAVGAPVRYGHAGGFLRYKCYACRPASNVLTGTPLAGLLRHREACRLFAQALIDGQTVRASARIAGVHRNTAIRWRHRFLSAPAAMQAQHLVAGIAEAGETFMRRSYNSSRKLKRQPHKRGGGGKKKTKGRVRDNGVGVLVTRDCARYTPSEALNVINCDTINATVGDRLDREAVRCTDGAPTYQRYAIIREIVREPANLAQGICVRRPAFYVQNVNTQHSRWKGWIDRFHSVATRYVGRHRLLDANRDDLSSHRNPAADFGRVYPHSTVT